MKIKFHTLCVALIVVYWSCNSKSPYYEKAIYQTAITEVEFPQEIIVGQPAQIALKIQAPNGCWSQLHAKLNKITPAEYQLKAYGFFESYGVCPEMIVTRDTVITFTAELPGTIALKVWRQINDTETHLLTVQEQSGK